MWGLASCCLHTTSARRPTRLLAFTKKTKTQRVCLQAVLFELSAEVIADLRRSLSILTRTSQASVRVVQANSYEQLIRNPPQCHQRQLIFLDPPYDSASTYFTWNIYMLRRLYKHWTSATIVLWFPYYSPEQTDVLLKRVQQLRLGQAWNAASYYIILFSVLQ